MTIPEDIIASGREAFTMALTVVTDDEAKAKRAAVLVMNAIHAERERCLLIANQSASVSDIRRKIKEPAI